MGTENQILSNISMAEAYSKIRDWYQSNVQRVKDRDDDYGRRSAALIQALPPVSATTDLEKRAIFEQVISNLLEWGYTDSDGNYKMFEYARGAVQAAGLDWRLSDDDLQELKTSPLWPFLSSS